MIFSSIILRFLCMPPDCNISFMQILSESYLSDGNVGVSVCGCLQLAFTKNIPFNIQNFIYFYSFAFAFEIKFKFRVQCIQKSAWKDQINTTRINQTRIVFFVQKHFNGANRWFGSARLLIQGNLLRELKCVTHKSAAKPFIFLVTCLDSPACDVDL